MADDRVVFEAWETEAGVCMTHVALAAAADVPADDIALLMWGWSAATRARCIFEADGRPPMLTVAGIELALVLLTSDDVRIASIRRRLAETGEGPVGSPDD